MTDVIPLNKIKWSILLTVSDKLSTFTQCIEKLTSSIDPKRSEIIYLGKQDNRVFLDIFSSLCEKKNIPYNYGDSQAHALDLAKGQYIVFMTDHTIVSKQFLVKLAFAMENSDRPVNRTAIVAPVSNEIAPDLNITPHNLDQLQGGLANQKVPYVYTLKLSPFCVMARKEVCRSYQNMREMVLQTNYDGYISVSVNDCLVYHYPEELDEAVSHVFLKRNEEPKLGILYRVKIDSEAARGVFLKSLQRSAEISDNIYVLDDNSKFKLGIYFKDNYPELWGKIKKYEKFSRPYDQKRDYNELIEWAEKDGCTWILSLEAEEVIEKKVTKEYLKRFLSPNNPEIFGYKVSHYIFYNSPTKWRVDTPWGKNNDIRLCRLFPGRRITKPGALTGQTGYVPSLPELSVRESGIRIKDYGYVEEQSRLDKKELFEKMTLVDRNQKANFDYLITENGMHRYDWVEDNKVTIYTPIRQGGDLLWSWLDTNAYFADEILVGNDSDKLLDADIELIESYPNAKIVPTVMGDNFAEGRNKIISQVKTQWIFQLDIDEASDNLLGLRRLIDVPNIDCWMFDITNHQKSGTPIITQTIRMFKNKDGVSYWGRLHETIDNHVKKNAWKISKSPVKMSHFGYQLQSEDQAYEKMQRYLDINLQQMKENPWHGMAYYNVALHFINDDLVEDAVKLLEIGAFLNPTFPLVGIELARNYLKKSNRWFNVSLSKMDANHPVRQKFESTLQQLNQMVSGNHIIARGHCVQYFNIHADKAKWLREHIIDMEKKIEEKKTEIMEKRAKAK